jgi:hypothetical protein
MVARVILEVERRRARRAHGVGDDVFRKETEAGRTPSYRASAIFWRKAERRCGDEVQRRRKWWFIYLRSWTPRHQHRHSRLFARSEGPGRTSVA